MTSGFGGSDVMWSKTHSLPPSQGHASTSALRDVISESLGCLSLESLPHKQVHRHLPLLPHTHRARAVAGEMSSDRRFLAHKHPCVHTCIRHTHTVTQPSHSLHIWLSAHIFPLPSPTDTHSQLKHFRNRVSGVSLARY